jgi:hypothetical protein
LFFLLIDTLLERRLTNCSGVVSIGINYLARRTKRAQE